MEIIIKLIEQSNSKFLMKVDVNGSRPNYHRITVRGINTFYHEEKLVSTSALEDTCLKMELDARLSAKPAFEIEEYVYEMLKGNGFEKEPAHN
jgi:hypothetical protein